MPSSMGMQQGAAPLIAPDAGGYGEPILYGSADYLLWKVQGSSLPASAVAIPVGAAQLPLRDTVINLAGNPQPINARVQTIPVFATSNASLGNGNTNIGYQNGGRLTAGFWVDQDKNFGLEASGLMLARETDHFAAISTQSATPFTAPTGFTQTLFITSATTTISAGPPPVNTTTITTVPQNTINIALAGQTSSQFTGYAANSFYGGELNARGVFLRIGDTDFGCLGGFRFLNFNDEISLSNSVALSGLQFNTTPATVLPPISISSVDRTRVYNYFYGAQVGGDVESRIGSFFVYARGKIALGTNHQIADVNSTTTTISNNAAPVVTGGGVLAGPTDNGRHTRDSFAAIPEGEVKVGYQFTDWLRGSVGYTGIFLNNVGRASDTTGTNTLTTMAFVNGTPTNVNVVQPTFRFRDRDVTIQGITFSLEARY